MISKRRFLGKFSLALLLFFSFFSPVGFANTGNADERAESKIEEGFDMKETTFHHLLDNYNWEFYKKDNGEEVGIFLPRILYNAKSSKLEFFSNTDAAIEGGYALAHHFNEEAAHGDLVIPESKEELEALKIERNTAVSEEDKAAIEKKINAVYNESRPWDFSITKNVVLIFIAAALMLIVFTATARGMKKNAGKAPKGIQAWMEPVVVFVRDDVAKENIGHGYEKFTPLLLTMFFFIWFLNMMGMIPFSGNVTGNISVTLSLSLVTLVVTTMYANWAYWKHILWPPVPHWVKIILIPVELVGVFTKPMALTIRLFANMTAGHVIVISLISLIFIFGKMGANPGVGYSVGIGSGLFVVAISMLELFVCALQAFVFTMLTAVFIGQAIAEEEHH